MRATWQQCPSPPRSCQENKDGGYGLPQPSVRTGFRNDRNLRRWSRILYPRRVSLRLGQGAALTCRRHIIHSPLLRSPWGSQGGICCVAALFAVSSSAPPSPSRLLALRPPYHNMSLRGAKRRGNPFPRPLSFVLRSRPPSPSFVPPSPPGGLSSPWGRRLTDEGVTAVGSIAPLLLSGEQRRGLRIATTQCCAPGFAMTETCGAGPRSQRGEPQRI